jgi:hypothetical protein
MRLRTIILSVTIVVLLSSIAVSQPPARESFEYSVGEPLEGLNGGTGWGGSWFLHADTDEAILISDEDFSYNDEIAYPINNVGNHAIGTLGNWGGQTILRPLATTWPNEEGAEYWMSIVYAYEGLDMPFGWGLVAFYHMDATDTLREGPGIGTNWRDEIVMGSYVDWAGGEWPPAPIESEGVTAYNVVDGPQWLVVKMVMSGDTLSRAYMWISPDPGGAEPDTNFADAKADWNLLHGLQYVGFNWGGQTIDEGIKHLKVDELRLGTSWDNVSQTPAVGVPYHREIPLKFSLSQNYPNPFNPSTNIQYSIIEADHVTLKVFNILGQEVATLVDEVVSPGTYQKTFDASRLPSGIYLYRIQTGTKTEVKKMILMK